MKKNILIILVIFSYSIVTYGQTVNNGSSLEAYKLAKDKKWKEANVLAKSATALQPYDAEAWYLLGLSEERLEHLSDAISAYEKYLKLDPAPAAAKAVEDRINELRSRARLQDQAIYGASSNGLFIEKQLSYNPSFVSDINGSIDTPFSFGFRFGKVNVGYRNASGTYSENIKVATSSSSSSTYTTVTGGGKITHQELFANIYVSLVDPYTTMGNFQLALPICLGGFMNTLETNTTGKKYGNIGYDLGLGMALRAYTRSAFSFYAQGIYHLSFPFWKIRDGSTTVAVKNANNEEISGSINNFELAVGITILFGENVTQHF